MSGDGFTISMGPVVQKGYEAGKETGVYVQKLDSIATATPKNEPLFSSSIANFTTLGVVANAIHENAPKAKAVLNAVGNDMIVGAKKSYNWMVENSLFGRWFGAEAVHNANKAAGKAQTVPTPFGNYHVNSFTR